MAEYGGGGGAPCGFTIANSVSPGESMCVVTKGGNINRFFLLLKSYFSVAIYSSADSKNEKHSYRV